MEGTVTVTLTGHGWTTNLALWDTAFDPSTGKTTGNSCRGVKSNTPQGKIGHPIMPCRRYRYSIADRADHEAIFDCL